MLEIHFVSMCQLAIYAFHFGIHVLKTRYPIQEPTNLRGPILIVGGPFKARAKLCMDLPAEIGTRGNQTLNLERSTLQDS